MPQAPARHSGGPAYAGRPDGPAIRMAPPAPTGPRLQYPPQGPRFDMSPPPPSGEKIRWPTSSQPQRSMSGPTGVNLAKTQSPWPGRLRTFGTKVALPALVAEAGYQMLPDEGFGGLVKDTVNRPYDVGEHWDTLSDQPWYLKWNPITQGPIVAGGAMTNQVEDIQRYRSDPEGYRSRGYQEDPNVAYERVGGGERGYQPAVRSDLYDNIGMGDMERGFFEDPNSSTGWSYSNGRGLVAQGVTPHAYSRVLQQDGSRKALGAQVGGDFAARVGVMNQAGTEPSGMFDPQYMAQFEDHLQVPDEEIGARPGLGYGKINPNV